MAPTVRDRQPAALLPSPDTMVKADLRKPEPPDDWRQAVGQAIRRAMVVRGWSLKELAGAIDRDERQVARWMDGTERPQLDTLFAVATLRQPLVQAFGELAGADVHTTITMRKVA